MFRMLMGLVSIVIVPALLFIAWRGWFKISSEELSSWRKGVGSAALLVSSVNWILTIVSFAPTFAHYDSSQIASLRWTNDFLSQPLSVVAVALAISLRWEPRIQALLAGLLMAAFWPPGYI